MKYPRYASGNIGFLKTKQKREQTTKAEADQGFPEIGLICIKVWGFAFLIFSVFS